MASNVNSVLKEALNAVKPTETELRDVNSKLNDFLKKIRKNIKSSKIKADVFVGGSFAKKTLIRKELYDIDIFIRFDTKHKEPYSALMKKVLKGINNLKKVHGSRDYFTVRASKSLTFEIVPVKRIKNPKESENITDLSYSHVAYIKKKLKGKLLDDVLLAKAFCHANNCYGAESYIKGFSGYALELLVYHYDGFLGFLRAMVKIKPEKKEIIDIEKHHKSKQLVMMDLNAAKLQSPIVLIDPTYRQRNALAALSEETFKKFRTASKRFLSKPTLKAFKVEALDFRQAEKNAKKKNLEFIPIEISTNKQPGDVAGSKLQKFYKHLEKQLEKHFELKEKGFEYQGTNKANAFFTVKKRKEIIKQGPHVKHEKHVKKFKAKHKRVFIKNNRLHVRHQVKVSGKQFLQQWKTKNSKQMKEMYVTGLKIG